MSDVREGPVETAASELAASHGGQGGFVSRGHNDSPPTEALQQEGGEAGRGGHFEHCPPDAPPVAPSREVEQGEMDLPAQEAVEEEEEVDRDVATHVVQAMTSGLSTDELTGLMLSGAGKGALDDALLEQMRIR